MKQLLIGLFALTCITGYSQKARQEVADTPAKAGGVYYAYPVTESNNTPAPKGYTPFYISHYGRHGSRYLISDKDYSDVIDVMRKAHDAGKLTSKGEEAYDSLLLVWEEAYGRGGELTPLGARQHHDIAQRMYKAYPQAFAKGGEYTAASTQVMRCAHSMFNFIEGLKELDPSLVIPKESNARNMNYLCHSEPPSWDFNDNKGRRPWKPEYENWSKSKVNPDRVMSTLFNDNRYVLENVFTDKLLWGLYWIAVDMQNMETEADFLSLFTPEELYDLWDVVNASFYIKNSSYPDSDGLNVDNAKNLMRNILDTANDYVDNGKHGATLRFGHDGNIVPLAALMRFTDCHGYSKDLDDIANVWQSYNISPMASNMQMVFFRDKQGDVIVKFMMNEQETAIDMPSDIFPFYRWNDVKKYMQEAIDTPSVEFCPKELRK
ncbi:MAG: histidine phosphatase family protein [Muribaculaceae bacterium]|nr:histidine phosphatase family protein [Muribaculaceae bacterium]MDE6346127.1 histidine phosphatase family protein [Muribaculaceae bacterium]